jgi:hypothetical protein
MQTSLPEQSVAFAQGQGPFVPPQALQRPDTHAAVPAQSVLSTHSCVFGGVWVVGATHTPALHTSPRGHAASVVHFWAHPTVVQTASGPQAAAFRHAGFDGVGTVAQPKPSHV